MSGLVRSTSSIPYAAPRGLQTPLRGGEVEPTRLLHPINDPELRAAFMAAHRGWAVRHQPHLLKEWNK
jgi:hypothetical protein